MVFVLLTDRPARREHRGPWGGDRGGGSSDAGQGSVWVSDGPGKVTGPPHLSPTPRDWDTEVDDVG